MSQPVLRDARTAGGTVGERRRMIVTGAEQELHWLALLMVPGLGPRRARLLLERFGSPQAVFQASRSELESLGLPGSLAQSIASGCSFEEAALQHEKARAAGATIIPFFDERYPRLLREILDPPIVLFARGKLEVLQAPMLAVVGTRRPTPYGRAVAEHLARDLAQAGLVIVSGMARGIDTAAHQGALAAGAPTVAVFGCGLNHIYPVENRKLAEEIATKGLLVSEFPFDTPAHPQNFPIRNRVISGMSWGVLVVEGAQYSGSAITARLALEQGREVFAVPGNITSKMSWGPNLLIKQGAKLVQEANDVLEELPTEVRLQLRFCPVLQPGPHGVSDGAQETGAGQRPSIELGPLTETASKLLNLLKVDEPVHLDWLLDQLQPISTSEVVATLFELELRGLARQLAGRKFVKVWGGD